MSEIGIEQDYEVDDDGEVLGSLLSFWTRGHGFNPDAVIRAVVDFSLEEHRSVPRIDEGGPVDEVWQKTVHRASGVWEYRRSDVEQPGWDPITLVDLEHRYRGGRKCAVQHCPEPGRIGEPVRLLIEPSDSGMSSDVAYVYVCRFHAKRFPQPPYRVCMIPVGAEVVLPAPDSEGSS